MEEGTSGLHFSGLEGLRGKRRLDRRGGAMYLLSLPLCAKALEERSVLDTSGEVKSRGVFSLLPMRGLRKGLPHGMPSQQPGAATRPSKEST